MNPSAHKASQTASYGWSTASLSRCVMHVMIVSVGLLAMGCAGIRVEHLTEETYSPRRAENHIEWLNQGPATPHIELARIVVSSTIWSSESLRHTLLERARAMGADALISEVPVTMVTQAGSPYFEPGLFGPSGAAFNLYGYGWYTPYASNPYLLTQGATDQPRIEHVVSAIAIRYQQDSDKLPPP